MRAIRQSGSEGGAADSRPYPYGPYQRKAGQMSAIHCKPLRRAAHDHVAPTELYRYFGGRYFYKDFAPTELCPSSAYTLSTKPSHFRFPGIICLATVLGSHST